MFDLTHDLIDSHGDFEMATMEQVRPAWYTEEDDTAWNRIKAAFRRDWRQTQHDFGGSEPNLNQQVGDTLSQAAGSKPIPPANAQTPHPQDPSYNEDDEHAYKYGYAAYRHYGRNSQWSERSCDVIGRTTGSGSGNVMPFDAVGTTPSKIPPISAVTDLIVITPSGTCQAARFDHEHCSLFPFFEAAAAIRDFARQRRCDL